MALLTEADRAYILEQLKLAPDGILADAMLALNGLRDKIIDVRTLVLNKAVDVRKLEVQESPEPNPVERPNVSPGASLISKIGGPTKALILEELAEGIQPGPKFPEHMKLLWARGEVKFDGEEYYL